ncbi:CHAD domain-containing protein [Peterkaempfera sp. SMS 1(5)a]|uniref:CYTH and CHAD domain-containing protein n=1 Tax=Peterkaempfera podocarpi TaxID=3232308 RepID=UPI00366AF425
MADSVREIERKYEAADGTTGLPPLDGIRGVAAVTRHGTATLDATYYDTADLSLVAQGVTLRRRTGGGDAGWHLKLPLGPDTREEVRLPLGEGTAVPGELTALVRARTRGQELHPVVRLVSVREVCTLDDADGRTLAEVSHDQVEAHRLGPAAPAEAAVLEWSEVEVELAAGSVELLDTVEQQLAAAGLRRSGSSSKLARALGTPSSGARRERPPLAAGGPTAGDAVLAHLAEHIGRLVALDAAVRRDQPDSVHQMRISARRLRSALKSFRAVLDRRATDSVADELKWLGTQLAADRDREVLTERLHSRVAALPAALVVGPVAARLRTWSVRSAARTREELVSALDTPRYLALLNSLDVLLADPPLQPAAARPAAQVLPAAVLRDWRRLADRIEPAMAAAPGQDRDLRLHEARKAAKRARYTAEAVEPVLGRPARRFRREMKAVQGLLGEHQDSVVARTTLRQLAADADAAGEPSFTYGLLHQAEHGLATAAERRVPGVWHRAARPKLRRRLSG